MLAPFLFPIVLDYALRISLDSSKEMDLRLRARRSPHHITDVDFADDLALISDLVTSAESLLRVLVSYIGLARRSAAHISRR